jgi:predicted nucleic acid-binding protein
LSRSFSFDTVVLSNFAQARRVDLLVRRYGERAQVTLDVQTEVLEGILAGYPALRFINDALENGELSSAGELQADEKRVYGELLRILAPGEASCIACALMRDGTVATDDRAARACCTDRNVPFTGTIGILTACLRDGLVGAAEADAILQDMIDTGYFSPVRRISDLL